MRRLTSVQTTACFSRKSMPTRRSGTKKAYVRYMRWHKECIRENDGVMVHPSDCEAWKVFDRFDADFASDARNVYSRLAIDDFDPFSTNSTSYSCWPIFLCYTTYHNFFV
jgi:hypothetical protein